jgi:predicted MFS family arabinose efflux permease
LAKHEPRERLPLLSAFYIIEPAQVFSYRYHDAYRRSDMSLPKPVAVFCGGIAAQLLTIGVARFAYTPLLPVMQAQAGLTEQFAGVLGAMIYAGYLLGTLTLAVIQAPAFRLAAFRLCLIIAVVSTAMMGMTQNIWIWAISRFLGGLSGVAGMLLAAEFILGWLRQNERPLDLGPHFMGLGLGISLAGLITLLLGAGADWALQWNVFAAAALVLLPIAWILTPSPAKRRKAVSSSRNVDVGPGAVRWFWVFGTGYFAAGWGYAVGATFCVDILTSGGQSQSAASTVWLILGISNAMGAMLGSVASRRFGPMPVLLVCMACQILSLVGFILHEGLLLSYLCAILFGGSFVVIVSLSLMLAGLKMPRAGGTAMARMTLLYGAGQILAPIATSRLLAVSGSYSIPLLVAALILTAGLFAMWSSRGM